MTADTMNYIEGYAAFVDILGFGNLVHQADKDEALRSRIVEALKSARQTAPPSSSETNLKYHFFSDSIIATSQRSVDGLWHLLLSIDALAHNLLIQDVWVRGGVAHGNIYNDEVITFGTAINEAYRLESNIAKYPRIMLSGSVRKHAFEYAAQSKWAETYFTSRIRRDRDGVYFLHYLMDYQAINQSPKSKSSENSEQHPLVQQGKGIAWSIRKRLHDITENPDVFAKAEWMAKYWNRSVETKHGVADQWLEPIDLLS